MIGNGILARETFPCLAPLSRRHAKTNPLAMKVDLRTCRLSISTKHRGLFCAGAARDAPRGRLSAVIFPRCNYGRYVPPDESGNRACSRVYDRHRRDHRRAFRVAIFQRIYLTPRLLPAQLSLASSLETVAGTNWQIECARNFIIP